MSALEQVLRQGVNSDLATQKQIRFGIVTAVRGTDRGIEADVAVRTRHGRVVRYYNNYSTIPVQTGHRVILNLQYGDQREGGYITGLANPSRPQIVTLIGAKSKQGGKNGTLLTDYRNTDYDQHPPENPISNSELSGVRLNRDYVDPPDSSDVYLYPDNYPVPELRGTEQAREIVVVYATDNSTRGGDIDGNPFAPTNEDEWNALIPNNAAISLI